MFNKHDISRDACLMLRAVHPEQEISDPEKTSDRNQGEA